MLGLKAYDLLSTDVRLMALGLPARRKPGRPRALSFRERLNVALSWNEKLNARAQVLKCSGAGGVWARGSLMEGGPQKREVESGQPLETKRIREISPFQ